MNWSGLILPLLQDSWYDLPQHLDGVKHVFGYLKKHKDLIIPIHSSPIALEEGTPVEVGSEEGQKEIFELLYPDAIDEIDASFPEPCYDELPLTCYVDSDWAGDKSIRRSVTGS